MKAVLVYVLQSKVISVISALRLLWDLGGAHYDNWHQ